MRHPLANTASTSIEPRLIGSPAAQGFPKGRMALRMRQTVSAETGVAGVHPNFVGGLAHIEARRWSKIECLRPGGASGAVAWCAVVSCWYPGSRNEHLNQEQR